jgi:glucose/arabinose dehydrogenase
MKKYIIVLIQFLFLVSSSHLAQNNSIEDGLKNYKKYCGTCHGQNFQGGMSKSLIDGIWQFDSSDEGIAKIIKSGKLENGMPSFENVLNDAQISNIIKLIRSKEKKVGLENYEIVKSLETFDYKVNVELVTNDIEEPWAIDFISPSIALVTEKPGRLRLIKNGKLEKEPINGTPKVRHTGQGGLLDVAVDPNYEKNGWIYISFSHDIDGNGMTKLVRGKIKNNSWTNEEVLFEADKDLYINTNHHFGSRIVFDDNEHLFFSIGDRGKREHAQDLTRPNGKIHRIFRDGKIPKDNPFLNTKSAIPSIYAFGSRNAQGLSIEPATGKLWEAEHGQQGGDELNIIKAGKNYGWDKITYGINYDGSVSTENVKQPGMEVPVLFWRPSIAVCGIDFYKGDLFPKWTGHLIVGALKYEEVRLLDIEDDRVIHEETILKDSGRVRDVCSAPDGSIYIVLNQPDEIIRLTPSK